MTFDTLLWARLTHDILLWSGLVVLVAAGIDLWRNR